MLMYTTGKKPSFYGNVISHNKNIIAGAHTMTYLYKIIRC